MMKTWIGRVMAGLAVSAVAMSSGAAREPGLTAKQKDQLWAERGCKEDSRGQWFRDAKFGAFIHFGLYSQLGGYYQGKGPYRPAEQIMGLGDRKQVIPWDEYQKNVGGVFNPAKFDAAKWVKLMKDAGQKYVILTAKHHDGFCMFKTKTTSYNVVDGTPFKRDVVKELADACSAYGMPFCIYYSIGDWTAKDVMNPGYAGYQQYMEAQLKELLTNYPTAKMLWFDNYWYVDDQWTNDTPHAKELYTFARSVRPEILVNDRCGSGDTDDKHGDYATPENQLKGSHQSRYFEVVMTNTKDDNWGWVKGATNYRSAGEVIRNLIDSASKGGNFVLNVGPNADGEFPPEHVKLLEEVGKWTKLYGKAIYGTVPAPEIEIDTSGGAIAYATKTKDGEKMYIHVIKRAANDAPVSLRVTSGPLVEKDAIVEPLSGFVKGEGPHLSKKGEPILIPRWHSNDAYATVYEVKPYTPRPDPL